MLKRVSVVIENQLFSGTGTSPQIKGATQWATAFAAGSLANTIPSANEIDVIHAVANQVGLAFGTPNAIFVHPDTLNKIFGLKSTTGEPFQEVLYYDKRELSERRFVAPYAFGLPDPIKDQFDELRNSKKHPGGWAIAKHLRPKER